MGPGWLALIFAALTLWLVLGKWSAPSKSSDKRASREPEPQSVRQPVQLVSVPQVSVTAAPSAPRAPALVNVATDGLPFMPAEPDAPAPTGPVHPHPITAEHTRIFRENASIQALNDAMDSRDAQALRKYLARYRSEYPEDAHELQPGYELIADCLEQRPGSRAAAQHYFDEERGSSLRRFVLRHCLGGP